MMKPLVIAQDAFDRGGNELHRVLRLVTTANDLFDLGYNLEVFQDVRAARDAVSRLHLPTLPSIWDLHYYAASRKLPDEIWDQVYDESRMTGKPGWTDEYAAYGFPEIGEVMERCFDLIDAFEFRIVGPDANDDEPAYVEIANEDALTERWNVLNTQLSECVRAAGLNDLDCVRDAIPALSNITFKPYDQFRSHWIELIVRSQGFLTFNVPTSDGDSWHLHNEPYGWLTKRHGAALKAHGYKYQFAFWEEEVGDMRGHLWIQTNRGPLMLTDDADATWSNSVFPVQVSKVTGEPLFDLQEKDVPDHLMRVGQDVPKDLATGMFALTVDEPKPRKRAFWGLF